jgi:hypothetical protein
VKRLATLSLLAAACLLVAGQSAEAQTAADTTRFARASLVFASEQLSAPVSAFGHTFLVFHDSEFPEPDGVAVEFIGDMSAPKAGVLRALFWSIPGQYRLRWFRDKAREYELEDRDLEVHELRLSAAERQQLGQRVASALTGTSSYNFVGQNCSKGIHDLLTKALTNFSCRQKPYALPVDSVRALRRCGRIQASRRQPSGYRATLAAYQGLPRQDRSRWNLAFRQNDFPDPQTVSPTLAQAIGLGLDYRLIREDDRMRRAELFAKKKEFAQVNHEPETMPTGASGKGDSLVALAFSPEHRWGSIEAALINRSVLNTRNDRLRNSQLQVLRLSATASRAGLRPSEAVLLDLEALVSGSALRSGLVRKLDIAYSDWRDRAAFAARDVHAQFGLGGAAELGTALSLGGFLAVGAAYQSIESRRGLAAVPHLGLQALVWPFWQVRWRNRIDLTLWQHRVPVMNLRSDLVFFDHSVFVLAAVAEAMVTRQNHGFATRLVAGIRF